MTEMLHGERFVSRPIEALPDNVRYPGTPLIEISNELGFDSNDSVTRKRQTLITAHYPSVEELEIAIEEHFDECDTHIVMLTEHPSNRSKWSQIVLGYHFYMADTWLQANHPRACVMVLEWLRDEMPHLDSDERKYMPYVDDAIETITKELIHPLTVSITSVSTDTKDYKMV